MARKPIEVSTAEFEAMISELVGRGDTELHKAAVSALRAVANRAKKRTYANFQSLRVAPKVKPRRRAKGSMGDTAKGRGRAVNGRLVTVKKLKEPMPLVYIGIRGNWKAKFFELGTRQRYSHAKPLRSVKAKSKWRATRAHLRGDTPRGFITAGRYFDRALEETRPEFRPALEEALKKSIRRAALKTRSLRGK